MSRKKATGFVSWATHKMKSLNEWNRVTFVSARCVEHLNVGGSEIGGVWE